MQFHLNGFKAGDPEVLEPKQRSSEVFPDDVDVLIVGCGPAGLTLAAQLAAFPEIRTRIVEQKSERLLLGQADGIACRTVEMFEAFGFAERVCKEAYWVNETSFWKPDETRREAIVRSGRIQDTEDGLSEFPHVILNQARVHDFYLDVMRNAPTRLEPTYARRLVDLDIAAEADDTGYPITVRLERLDIELDKLSADERVSGRNITSDHLIAAAQRILHPYTLDVKEVAWWSVYEIGQRLCDKFDDVPEDDGRRLPRVFIAGDACHTHSPKAGQGMNVSMQDAFNLGWKLASVLKGEATPELLHTYSGERRTIAKELIDFDREFAKMFSAPPKSADSPEGEGVDPAEFQKYFVMQGRFTAGTATRYTSSMISAEAAHQHLATGFPVGMRFHSAPVVRLADAKPMHLGHTVKADGRWRVFAFADAVDPAAESSRLQKLCTFLAEDAQSPVRRHTPAGADIDSVIDVRAVFQQPHRALEIAALPDFLLPRKGRYDLRDYEKMFSADPRDNADIFDLRGIDRSKGALVVVRPDQYVAHVLPLDAHRDLAAFFAGFMRTQ